ncbi:transglutaminase domain-containing protein [Arthrobacter sp. PAMC25564]|uniref:transglutaminase family protein n=1 Tax=Arthrobacter sp. PAMC25564 TaxID=2565366 RepID=UPI0010A276DD|nr:DUF3488 and transglutaminase-like domain-containing protein [Arthrobacter sp. PAMC25564]QCB98440.1 transglutaminase domain-containing protein [Arthrobacter sp. PAMC25564]
MTLAPQRTPGTGEAAAHTPGAPSLLQGAGVQPWAMGLAVAVAVAGPALSLNGVLRGWAWYSPVFTTVVAVAFAMAVFRALRLHALLVASGGFAALVLVLTFTFFRQRSIAGFIPSPDTMDQLGMFLRRASETVLAESSPVAPNAGIVMLICAVLGLMVILVDALAFPLAMPATSGFGILAILVVPAVVKPQSVGALGFAAAAVGYLLILGCSRRFAPDPRTRAGTAPDPGQFKRAVLTGAVALTGTLLLQLVIPGFDQGTFPQGSRLNPFGPATGLNPMISLGTSLRSPSGDGRITYATNAPAAPYLRSVTVDSFEGDAWAPDDRQATRRLGTGRMDAGLEPSTAELRVVTAINTGQFTSPYLPAPYAPEAVNGLTGRWSWDPATLSIKGVDTNSREQQYVVLSVTPQLTPELLAQSTAPAQGVADQFTRQPNNVPEIVRKTADSVTAGKGTPYAKAMAIQQYLRSPGFSYSLQSPVQGGYDGNGLSVLADFLTQKSGYCIHFASAMAVMARLEGIPSRIAVGYAPGRPTGGTVSIAGQGALPEFEVDARDAHAWPELYFQGAGWVAFEPTPSRGVVPAYAAEPSTPGGASTNENSDGLTPRDRATPVPAPGTVPVPIPGAPAAAGNPVVPVLSGAVALLLLALLAASPRLARGTIRRRRLTGAAGGAPVARAALPAWAELRDLGTDYGVSSRTSETPRHFSARLLSSGALGEPASIDAAVNRAVAALTGDFERQEYGRPAGAPVPDGGTDDDGSSATRIALVQAALRANAKPLVRFRADWLPPSVLAAWRRSAASAIHAVSGTVKRIRRGAADAWLRIHDAVRRLRRG